MSESDLERLSDTERELRIQLNNISVEKQKLIKNNIQMRNKQIAAFLNEEMIRAFLPYHDTNNCNDEGLQSRSIDHGIPRCRRCFMLESIRSGFIDDSVCVEITLKDASKMWSIA
jgi:hypothetical protein